MFFIECCASQYALGRFEGAGCTRLDQSQQIGQVGRVGRAELVAVGRAGRFFQMESFYDYLFGFFFSVERYANDVDSGRKCYVFFGIVFLVVVHAASQ